MRTVAFTLAMALPAVAAPALAAELPIFDAHVHYSHDAWDNLPPKDAVAILRKAGVKRALVSSSGDEGTQRLVAAAPDLVVPSLRPYRTRGDVSTWVRDESVAAFLEGRLARQRYAAIGEFPDRFMVGTDTYTPEHWHYIVEHANWSRAWLADLPPPLAERIAYRNADALFAGWNPARNQ